DVEFYRRVVGKERATKPALVLRPRARRPARQAADEHLVDAVRQRRREPGQARAAKVEIAGDDRLRLAGHELAHPREVILVTGDVDVRDVHAAVDPHAVDDAAETIGADAGVAL